jgi:hypothetical protein
LNKQTRRVLFAAVLSLTVYGATWYWYSLQKNSADQHQGMKPIAYVSTIQEDARRRPASRLIWQLLSSGDPLYTGEAIKTSDKSEVRIQFMDGERYIDLDPDSLVVISSGKNEISLDLMNGSILVAGGSEKNAEGSPLLTLNSGKGKVDLSHATASLSKSSKGVDVQVLKGKATNENGQEVQDSEKEMVTVLSPRSDRPAVINPELRDPIKFAWQGFPANSIVSLWTGSSRNNLQMVGETKDPSARTLEKQIAPGKHFFKLVAKDPKTPNVQLESKIHRFEVVTKYPPGAIAPANEANIVSPQKESPIAFKWENPEDAKSVSIEISKDPNFKHLIANKNFSGDQEAFTQSLPGGEYYWRLSSTYNDVDHAIFGKPMHFLISSKPKVALKIQWLPSGVASLEHGEVQYFIDKPNMNLAWDIDRKDEVKTWKVHVWPARLGREPSSQSSSDSDTPIQTDKQTMKTDLPNPGNYYAAVEGYNEFGVLLASSETKSIEVAERPLLKAPTFEPGSGDLSADSHGNLPLKWTSDKDVKEYHLRLLDGDGKEIKNAKFAKNSTSLINLMPGHYKVDIYAVDTYGRDSQRGVPRVVTVPDSSGLKAPKLKKVKVD